MHKRLSVLLVSGALLVALLPGIGLGKDFYKGKTIRILVGFTPGGGPDIRARLVARHWSRFIPGEPKIIVQNRPGAGGLIAVNSLYNLAKPDGLTLGNAARDASILQLSDKVGVQFDMLKFAWVGSLRNEGNVAFIRSSLPYKSLEDLRKADKPLVFAARSVGATNYLAGKGLEFLGVPIKMVVGYGTAKLNLAFIQGEVDASALGWTALSKGRPDWIKPGGAARMIVEFGAAPTRGLDVPFGPDRTPVAGKKGLYQLINKALGLPQGQIAAPPGTPKERMTVLRVAYRKMLHDPAFLSDAGKLNLTPNALIGEDLLAVIKDFLSVSPNIVAQFKEVLR